MVFLELMAELGSWVPRALVVPLVLLVLEVPMEMPVAPESLASWDPEVFPVPLEMLAQLVKKVPWVSLGLTAGPDPLALLEQEESLATSDSLGPKAPLVMPANLEKKVTLVLLVPGVPQVLMETMVLRDLLDPRVSKAEKGNRVLLDLQASRDCLALQVQLVKLANPEKEVSLVNSVFLVPLVQEGSVVPPVKVVLLVLLVLLEAEVPLDPQGLMETRVNLETWVLRAVLVLTVPVGSPERGVLLASLEARETRVNLASEVKWGAQAEMVLGVLLVPWVPLVLLELPVTGVKLVPLAPLVPLVLVVALVNVVKLVPLVPMDLLVLLVPLVSLVLKERKEPEGPRVRMVSLALQAP